MPVKLLQASGLPCERAGDILASLGGPSTISTPHSFILNYETLLYFLAPGSQQWGSDRQAPKMSWASWGNNIRLQQAQARTRRIFNHYHQRNVCWRSRDDIMFVYCILSILLAQYTHEFLFLLINQMFRVKKKNYLHEYFQIERFLIKHSENFQTFWKFSDFWKI